MLNPGGSIWARPWSIYFVNFFCRRVPKEAGRKGGSDKPSFQGEEHFHSANWRTERAAGREDQSNVSIFSHQ